MSDNDEFFLPKRPKSRDVGHTPFKQAVALASPYGSMPREIVGEAVAPVNHIASSPYGSMPREIVGEAVAPVNQHVSCTLGLDPILLQ